jgi:hypothetical protein
MPYTPSANCAHLFVDYVNSFVDYEKTSADCIDFFTNYGNNYSDCMNKSDD